MEEIILAAIAKALSSFSDSAVKDAYQTLKSRLQTKDSQRVLQALESVEKTPDSTDSSRELIEILRDHESAQEQFHLFARSLLEIGVLPASTSVRQEIRGDSNIVTGSGDITIRGPQK